MKSNLFKRGFLSLIATQFFGAMNDNVLKMVLIFMVNPLGLWDGDLGKGGAGMVGVFFTVPFILLSGFAGQIADRYSKRQVTLWVKIAEVPIAIVAAIGFYSGNLWLVLLALTALTCQSSFFGPAKYGMIPELVDDSDLSRANGTINMMTNLAVIGGALLAGWVGDAFYPKDGSPGISWLPGLVLISIAVGGLISAFFLTPLQAGDRSLKFEWNPFSTYVETIREMAQTKLLMVMLAWGYFYLLAGLALAALPGYDTVLGVSRFDASVLLAVLGVSVGVGCGVAGLISGHKIEPRLIPIGAFGLILFFALLGAVPPWMPDMAPMLRVGLSNVAFFVFGAGFFAGFYIIPLQALLQKLSPDDERGRFLGTANAVSFTFLAVAGLLYWFVKGEFKELQHVFYMSSALMAVGAAFFLWMLRGTGLLVGSRPTDSESEVAPAVDSGGPS